MIHHVEYETTNFRQHVGSRVVAVYGYIFTDKCVCILHTSLAGSILTLTPTILNSDNTPQPALLNLESSKFIVTSDFRKLGATYK